MSSGNDCDDSQGTQIDEEVVAQRVELSELVQHVGKTANATGWRTPGQTSWYPYFIICGC